MRFLPPVVQGTCRHHRPVVLPRCGEQAAVTCWCIPCPLSSSGVASRQRSPAGASLAPCPPQVWRAGSGHLLVRPRIDGVEGGFMVVDTGASGFVISPEAAGSLGLTAFGELFAASISGKVRGVMTLSGKVRGGGDNVGPVGLTGKGWQVDL